MTQVETALARKLGRQYELVYILQPQIDPDEADKIAQRITDVCARLGGTITKVDSWGKRRLAYPIKRFSRGIFVYVRFAGIGDLVAELERNLRNFDGVMRFQSVRLEGTVDLDALSVNEDEVKFARVELDAAEEEPEPTFEERLGLAARARHEEDDESELMGDDGDEPTPEVPAATPSTDEN